MIRSKKLRQNAQGKPCTLRFDCCDGGGETTVLAHLRDGNKGMAQKASDLSGCYACAPCHNRLDHEPHKIDPADFYWHHLRALQETLQILHDDGLLVVPLDPVKPLMDKPIKARKPVSQRTKIPSRPFSKRKVG